jgi:hypothetical protein
VIVARAASRRSHLHSHSEVPLAAVNMLRSFYVGCSFGIYCDVDICRVRDRNALINALTVDPLYLQHSQSGESCSFPS